MENNNFDFMEAPKETVSLADINAMVKRLFEMKEEIKAAEEAVSLQQAEMDALKAKVMGILEAQNLKNFTNEFGQVYRKTEFQVSYPKDPSRAAQLRAYFAQRGMEDRLTVNHQTLNSFYKSLVDEAEAQGLTPDLDTILPGVEKPTARDTLAMKKGKAQ